MSDYFVRKSGSDSNDGLSPATAWLTINKALGATGIADTTITNNVYIGAGTFREVVTVAMTSATAEQRFIADVDGDQTGDAGRVVWTAYLTDEKTTPSTSPLLTLAGRDFLTFEGFYLVGGSSAVASVVNGTTTTSTNITFRQCVFWPAANASNLINVTTVADTAFNWLVTRCVLLPSAAMTVFRCTAPTTGGGVDYDVGVTIRNCLIGGTQGQSILLALPSGALANSPGGILVQNCKLLGGTNAVFTNTNWSTAIPLQVYNCWIFGANTGLNATTSGQIVEDYNLIQATTARANVTAGGNSIATFAYAAMPEGAYGLVNGFLPRPFFEPFMNSALLDFGNTGAVTALTTDLWGRPKPAGGLALGIGDLERHDTALQETTTVDAGTSGLVITGPGDHDLLVPVNAASTTISIKARYDTDHGTTNKPQAILLAAGSIGVSAETLTMTAAADTWETLTFAGFTPSDKGFVTIRLVSRAAAATGKAFFDTADVPDISTEGFDYFRRGEPFPAGTGSGAGGGGPKFLIGG